MPVPLAGTLRHQGHTYPTLLPFQVPDEQTVARGGGILHLTWLFLGCHTHRHMSALLTEKLPDITEGRQRTLPSGEKTQSQPRVKPLTLPQTDRQTDKRGALLPSHFGLTF